MLLCNFLTCSLSMQPVTYRKSFIKKWQHNGYGHYIEFSHNTVAPLGKTLVFLGVQDKYEVLHLRLSSLPASI